MDLKYLVNSKMNSLVNKFGPHLILYNQGVQLFIIIILAAISFLKAQGN